MAWSIPLIVLGSGQLEGQCGDIGGSGEVGAGQHHRKPNLEEEVEAGQIWSDDQ